MTSWYEQFDGDMCGCIALTCPLPTIHRRFSPFCRIVDVVVTAPQVYFRVGVSPQYDSSALTFNHSRVYLELRRKGSEFLIATYNAWRRDANGYIGFYFDDTFFAQCPGFYVGDIYIDCHYCMSVQLRIPPCEAFVTDCYVQPALEDCALGICSVMDAMGVGAMGGLLCEDTTPSLCGDVAPFFPIDNPSPPPEPVCDVSTACCFIPACAAGSAPVG